MFLAAVAAATLGGPVRAATTFLGPLNPGFENGAAHWNAGASGDSSNFVAFSYPLNGPSGAGANCVLESNDGSGQTDLRADFFSLGAASLGTNAISIDFDYNIPGSINFGDQIRLGCRFEDSGGGFLAEYNFHLGTPNADVGGSGWHHFHGVAASPNNTAVNMDIRITMNIFGDDTWSSGGIFFDNFAVNVTPHIGPDYNGNCETGAANWNGGGSGGAAGSISANFPANGPSEPGTNCFKQTSDGSGNTDFRVNNFWLGGSTRGAEGVAVDFDYNIPGPISFGDQIRVGLRFEDSGGGFLGENNFHLGTPNNDVGGTGWHHFHGVAVDPTRNAVTADLRISMNVFGDDTWSSGDVYYDNFVVRSTQAIGPNDNGNYENGGATWNSGGPNNAGGMETYLNASNGLSGLGTNCAMMTADGSVAPSGGNDMRVNTFVVANNNLPVTISFDYNILNPFTTPNQIRVGFRFFNSGGNFNGEANTYIGTPNGDTGGQGWKHLSAVYTVPAGTLTADIRVSMNIFGDDVWSNGPVLFDNFVVITGTNAVPVAPALTLGTIENTPLTRIAGNGDLGATDPNGDPLMVSYITQPAHGTSTSNGKTLTYTPATGYTGADAFVYGVTDGLGSLATNSVSVTVNATVGLNKITQVSGTPGSGFTVNYSGAPYTGYILQLATSAAAPVTWYPVATNSANGGGSVSFTNQPGTFGAAFFRTLLRP